MKSSSILSGNRLSQRYGLTEIVRQYDDEPARPSDYFLPYDSIQGKRVLLACIVSDEKRDIKRNRKSPLVKVQCTLRDIEDNLRRAAHRKLAIVAGVFYYSGHRYCATPWAWRMRLAAHAAEADMIFVETVDRLARNPAFSPKDNPNAQPTEAQLANVKRKALYPIAIHLDPDASPYEQRSYQRKRGLWAAELRKPGYMKRRREILRKIVQEVWRENSLTLEEIGTHFGLPRQVVHEWLRQKDCK